MLHHGGALPFLRTLARESVSLVCTDPPYGLKFMGCAWDMGLPDTRIWRQCLRLLKPGAFLLSFMSPRLDCLAAFAQDLAQEGFDVGWPSIVWYYLNGMPKGRSLSKDADRRQCAERPVVSRYRPPAMPGDWNLAQAQDAEAPGSGGYATASGRRSLDVTGPATEEARRLEGQYGGRSSLKPAHEMIVVAQKPCDRAPIVANALVHGVGGLCCDAARIPGQPEATRFDPVKHTHDGYRFTATGGETAQTAQGKAGRFPATVAVTDQALGGDSRYFDVDRWAAEKLGAVRVLELEAGFVCGCPKASTAEKERGLEELEPGLADPLAQHRGRRMDASPRPDGRPARMARNTHPTVKPLSLVAWLVSLGCPPGGLVLDPFAGTATSGVACALLGRPWIGVELEARYCEVGRARLRAAANAA